MSYRGRAVWSLAVFSLELRILLATATLLYVAYRAHVFDEAIRLFLISNLERKFKLPIEIDSVRVDMGQGRLALRGVRMVAPPRDADPRWHYAQLMSADAIDVICEPVLFLYFFVVSQGKVISTIAVHVNGVQFFLEGFELPAASAREQPKNPKKNKVLYNFMLIGGEIKTRLRRRKPTLRDARLQQRSQHLQQRSQRLQQRSQRLRQLRQPHGAEGGSFPSAGTAVPTSVPVSQLAPEAQADVVPTPRLVPETARKPLRSSIFGIVSKANNYMKEAESSGGLLKHASGAISRRITDISSEVQSSGGLLAHVKSRADSVIQATAAKLDTAYQSAKERIKVSYERKIVDFHERLRGGEPIPDSRDGFIHLVELSVTNIEVHMRDVLPQRLRPLEKSSFFVPELVIVPPEFASLHYLIDQHGQVSTCALTTPSAVLSGRVDKHADGEHGRTIEPIQHTGSTSCGTPIKSPDVGDAQNYAGDYAEEFSALNTLSEYGHRVQQTVLDGIEAVLHFPVDDWRHRASSLLSISHLETAGLPGLPLCVLIYRLERRLLSEILKDNAGMCCYMATSGNYAL